MTTADATTTSLFGHPVQLSFTPEEFEDRQRRTREELVRRDLDGLLVFRIEDQHWLCGLDTTGFTIFHAMFIGVGGELTHLSRSADLANIAYSSLCSDVRLFDDAYGNTRARGIKDLLAGHGLQGRRIGVQLDTFGLLPDLYLELEATLAGWCELVDASDVVRVLRLVKSEQELTYMRRAGAILTAANDAAVRMTVPGAFEGDILGEFNRVVLAADGDICAEPNWPMGSGPKALLVRHVSGRRTVAENDQIIYEPGAAYRHYNVASMFTVLTGPDIDPRHLAMHRACVAALDAVQAVLRPGNTFGEVFAAHRDAFEEHGYGHAMLRACGYPMGAMWPPTWMEKPVIAEDDPLVLSEGMTIFTHMILTDRDAGLTMCLGETAAVTGARPQVLSPVRRSPYINEG
ncbi:MAG TPA: Xaa-Pro peptidase family protein [Nocardioides sp.]|uniref:M24 family metallopeptidase n=1 Tax=uncultured Nocardioides sp. TaxID=198441 RepID=UPI00262A4E3F|nr:Xaa-Pro peptidase family protein [uncultured Nocardioides sp.]HRI94296.1 Xaa-Pro peptidase family protein [Nocardioides sp.]HRK44242.1 Xaa-Pro peptidase family protein [Nocardioides sp.]